MVATVQLHGAALILCLAAVGPCSANTRVSAELDAVADAPFRCAVVDVHEEGLTSLSQLHAQVTTGGQNWRANVTDAFQGQRGRVHEVMKIWSEAGHNAMTSFGNMRKLCHQWLIEAWFFAVPPDPLAYSQHALLEEDAQSYQEWARSRSVWYMLMFEVAVALCFSLMFAARVLPRVLSTASKRELPSILAARAGAKYYRFLLPAFAVSFALEMTIMVLLLRCVNHSWVNAMVDALLHGMSPFAYLSRAFMIVGMLLAGAAGLAWRTYIVFRHVQAHRPLPFQGARLLHVVIVPNYKEPESVLRMTLNSIANQTLPKSQLIVVMAMEARDPGHGKTFEALEAEFGHQFPRGFWRSIHELEPGEVPGPGSNVRAAVSWVLARLREECIDLDPFETMVTKVDADSDLDPYYLEQVEWTYRHQPDGRRFLYHAATSFTRNLGELNFILQTLWMMRSQESLYDTASTSTLKMTYAHLSVSLGFCKEQGIWGPADEISEDTMQTIKASIVSGTLTTKKIWCINATDCPYDFKESFKQAYRHQWGITLISYLIAMSIDANLECFAAVVPFMHIAKTQWPEYPTVVKTILLFPEVCRFYGTVSYEARVFMLAVVVGYYTLAFVTHAVDELLMWSVFLRGRRLLERPPLWNHIALLLALPISGPLVKLLMITGVKWVCAVHAFFTPNFTFERTPKGTKEERERLCEEEEDIVVKLPRNSVESQPEIRTPPPQ